MGRIRLPFFRHVSQRQDSEPLSKKIPSKQSTEQIEHIEIKVEKPEYPMRSKKVRDADLPFIPAKEIERQDAEEGDRLWIVVSNIVLDVSDYVHQHPGGRSIIAGFAGQDCTWQWYSFHNRTIWEEVAMGLRIGRTEGVHNRFERPPAIVGLKKLGFDDWD